jgi:hypothetical protein
VVELKGSLTAVGLPAIVQLVGELHHSGTLELIKNGEARGSLGFDDGRLVSAEFEMERGMSALQACLRDLANADFRFIEGVAAGELTLDISAAELQRMIARAANGEAVADAPGAITSDEVRGAGVCPMLGFADDPARHYSRPTALHRCYSSDSPSLVTNQEQLDLCLGGQYPSCTRYRNAGSKSLTTPAAPPPREDRDEEVRAPVRAAARARVAATSRVTPSWTPPRLRAARAEDGDDDGDDRTGAARLRNLIGGLAAGRGLAAIVGLIGVGLLIALPALSGVRAPSRQANPNPAAAALATATAAPPVTVAAAQATALATIGAASAAAPASGAGPQPTAAAARTNVAIAAQATAGAAAAAQSATQAPTAARTVGAQAPAAAPAGAPASAPASSAGQTTAAASAAAGPRTGPTLAPTVRQSTPPTPAPTPTSAAPLTGTAGVRSLMDLRFVGGPADNWMENPPIAGWSDGAYRLQAHQPTQFVAISVPLIQVTSDVVVSATFRKTGGPPGGGYGVIVRDQGPLPRDGLNQDMNAYVLEAGDLGEFGVWRRVGDHWVDLVPWTRSSNVRPGGSPNDLLVRAIGDSLTFTINGARVASVQDDALTSGAVGVFVGGDYNEVALDHFAVQLPE